MKVLVAYDGSLHSKNALKYGLQKVRENGGDVTALHVFDSSQFVDYDAGPMAEKIARMESSRYVSEARKLIEESGNGIAVKIIEDEGVPEYEILKHARHENVDLILAPPRYKSMVRDAPCPVCIIPGTLLVAVDNSTNWETVMDKVIKEAKATASKVLLLGLVPVHLYTPSEQSEVKRIRQETDATMKKIKKLLDEQGLEVKGLMREGYPDEEILKAAEEHSISMIIIPADRNAPSELNKAADIILDEAEGLRRPVFVTQ